MLPGPCSHCLVRAAVSVCVKDNISFYWEIFANEKDGDAHSSGCTGKNLLCAAAVTFYCGLFNLDSFGAVEAEDVNAKLK